MADTGDDWALQERRDAQQFARSQHIEQHGFVRVTPALCAFLQRYGPWVEIGAGTGELSAGIRLAGGRALATDNFTAFYIRQGDWSPSDVVFADAERAARLVARSKTLNLLCSWPYETDWCYRAVRHLRVGQLFGYIGEGPGGQTGDVALHELLELDFVAVDGMAVEQLADDVHDEVVIFRRVRVTTAPPATGVAVLTRRTPPQPPTKPVVPIKRHAR